MKSSLTQSTFDFKYRGLSIRAITCVMMTADPEMEESPRQPSLTNPCQRDQFKFMAEVNHTTDGPHGVLLGDIAFSAFPLARRFKLNNVSRLSPSSSGLRSPVVFC